jgi:SAM-dependent methyltransferase
VRPTRQFCEADVVAGLEAIASDEIRRWLSCDARVVAPGVLRFAYAGDARHLAALKTVLSVYFVQRFDVPRPKALLGDQHLRAVLAQITRATALQPADYRTFMLAAAGRDSTTMARLAGEIARATGLCEVGKEGDLLIRLRRSATPAPGEGWDVLVRASPKPLATRDWRVCIVGGSLQATVAHAMAGLTTPRPDDVYLNLGCGSGTLLVERALAGLARRLIGCDTDPKALACARQNASAWRERRHGLAATSNSGQYGGMIELEPWDATGLPLPGASVDALAADLPFGHRVGSHADNESLYPALLAEAARVARPGARFVAITAELRLMERLMRAGATTWQVDRTLRVHLGGLRPVIFVLRKA